MCTCAWQFAANLNMSDISDDSCLGLYAVAAAAASVVLTIDITKRRLKKRRTWVRPLLLSRSEVGACDLLLPEVRATDTQARRRDWLQQFQLMNISVQGQKYANEPKIFYDGIYFILLQCYRSDVRTSAIK